MALYNVKNPDTKEWACFSSEIEDYITPFMDEETFKIWRLAEYGDKANRTPLEQTSQLLFTTAEKIRKEKKKNVT